MLFCANGHVVVSPEAETCPHPGCALKRPEFVGWLTEPPPRDLTMTQMGPIPVRPPALRPAGGDKAKTVFAPPVPTETPLFGPPTGAGEPMFGTPETPNPKRQRAEPFWRRELGLGWLRRFMPRLSAWRVGTALVAAGVLALLAWAYLRTPGPEVALRPPPTAPAAVEGAPEPPVSPCPDRRLARRAGSLEVLPALTGGETFSWVDGKTFGVDGCVYDVSAIPTEEGQVVFATTAH